MKIKIISVIFVGILFGLGHSKDVAEFRKRLANLKEEKAKCDEKSDIGEQQACMETYNKNAEKYKADYDKFKQDVLLESQKRNERQQGREKKEISEDIQDRETSIKDFEDFLSQECDQNKNARCAAALFQLGNLYYKNEEDKFRIEQTSYEKKMQAWEDNDKKGEQPNPARRNHEISRRYFERLVAEYPNYSELDKVYYRLAFVYSMSGQDEEEYQSLLKIVNNFPESALIPSVVLRIGEYFYLNRKYKQAIEYYNKVPKNYRGPELGLAIYHKAECYYNMADYEKASEVFYEYVIMAEKGAIKGDLKSEALEYMAASWADLSNGVEVAHNFLKNKNHPWKKDVFFVMGQKNKGHDRFPEAREAYGHLYKLDPNYPKLPMADRDIVEMLIVEKKPDEAQQTRINLVERYSPGSKWHKNNSSNNEGRKIAEEVVKEAAFQIPVFYHIEGAKDKENLNIDKLTLADQYYRKFIERYSEDSWEVYEAHQNIASVNHLLKRYEVAAKEYKWCAKAPVNKYGKIPEQRKSSILSQADAAYNMVYMLDLRRQDKIKQSGDNKELVYNSTETKEYFDGVDMYMSLYGSSSNAPDLAYNAALVHYEAKQYSTAIKSLENLREKYPNHQHSALIMRMLGQSLLEGGQYAKAEAVFTDLLAKTPSDAKQYSEIQLSVASAIYKQADKAVKDGKPGDAAKLYLRVVEKFGTVKIADQALFEAGSQFEAANDVNNATSTFLRLHNAYPKSDLKVKAILRAANIYLKNKDFRQAGNTFLIVRDKYTQDSLGFNSIGWAADAYIKADDKYLAARTFESALSVYPKNPQTPSFLYNAGQTYEEITKFPDAIRVYETLGKQYPNSSFSLDAVFSVPLIQEKLGQYSEAVDSYKKFLEVYKNDPQKSIRAELALAKIFGNRLNNPDLAVKYYGQVVKTHKEFGKEFDIPAAIAAEAGFYAGEIYFNQMSAIKLDGSKDSNKKKLKQLTDKLEVAVTYFSESVEKEEQEWTLRSTLRMGDLFLNLAGTLKDEKISSTNPTQIAGEKINIRRGLPGYYDKAKSLYQKNLDLAREFSVTNQWIDSSRVRYLETFYLKGIVFEEIGQILGSSPIPDELTEEEKAEYKAALDDKIYEAEQAAKPIYATGLKAAQFYGINNEIQTALKEKLKRIDPEAPELSLRELTEAERSIVFNDKIYKDNLNKIKDIYESNASTAKKVKQLGELKNSALEEVKKLQEKLKQISAPKN